jgi:CRP-like cAMP-binding protein
MTDFAAPGLLSLLGPDDRQVLASLGQRRSFTDGALIQVRGDPDAAMGVVIEGQVKLVRQLRDGRQLLMVTVNPGQHYADTNTFDNNPRTHHGFAVGDTVVDYYPHRTFLRLLEHPGIVRALYRISSFRLAQAIDMLDDIRAVPPEVRLAKLLAVMRASAGGAAKIDCLQDELASLLGVSAMTLAKALKALRTAGLIETGYRSITIADPVRMDAWLEASVWD